MIDPSPFLHQLPARRGDVGAKRVAQGHFEARRPQRFRKRFPLRFPCAAKLGRGVSGCGGHQLESRRAGTEGRGSGEGGRVDGGVSRRRWLYTLSVVVSLLYEVQHVADTNRGNVRARR